LHEPEDEIAVAGGQVIQFGQEQQCRTDGDHRDQSDDGQGGDFRAHYLARESYPECDKPTGKPVDNGDSNLLAFVEVADQQMVR